MSYYYLYALEPASRLDPLKHNNTFSSDFSYQNHNYAAETVSTSDYVCKTRCGSKKQRRQLHIMLQKTAADRKQVWFCSFSNGHLEGKWKAPRTRTITPNLPKTDFGAKAEKKYNVEAFTHRCFYTKALLHTNAFTHRCCYTQTLLHRDAFRHRRLYTQMFLQLHTLLHTDAFTNRCFELVYNIKSTITGVYLIYIYICIYI